MRSQERINLIRRIDKQMRIKKESNIINSVIHQTAKMNKGEISPYPSITLNVNALNSITKRYIISE
jgi:hypothetical protein